ncbi:mannitol dehydrogenase family protein [Pseudoclavibacter sp. RFBB5]|uniref:mannitol dehydrogenase family protein n=1 Tax=Pseudoclavibacter sp. RFBB5 TaxID=2080574 RepID=UPI000CE81B22|nr:mannitol dehydrogenase family protein [Pseudoclavibacter sp. RFBB5]PPG33500.1 oxidoreductase [Pseudoclavibacter sp. RFBB5]
MTEPLRRSTLAAAVGGEAAAPPVRLVHLGLGAFHRSHQVHHTALASDADDWGFASFTGRRPNLAAALRPQDGLYTLIARHPDRDEAAIIRNLSSVHDGADMATFLDLLAAPTTAVVTLTVTEASYRLRKDESLDLDDSDVASDIAALRAAAGASSSRLMLARTPATPLARVLAGLEQRRRSGVGGLAIVPCDNLLAGGSKVQAALSLMAQEISGELSDYVSEEVSVVSTSVDRITPSATPADVVIAGELTGFADASPVIAEPYSSWVLSGAFPAGRPGWEASGVEIVDDIGPFESRKLWFLNGAHSLLAYAGLIRGHTTVADAIADPVLRGWVEELWDDAASALPEVFSREENLHYREQLIRRFENRQMNDALQRIARDGAVKLRVRAVPVIEALEGRGVRARGACRAVAAWVLATQRGFLDDSPATRETRSLIASVDDHLADDGGVMLEITSLMGTLDEHSRQDTQRSDR